VSRIGIALYALGVASLTAALVAVLGSDDRDVKVAGLVALIVGVASFWAAVKLTVKDPEPLQHGAVPLPPGATPLGGGTLEGLIVRRPRREAWSVVVLAAGFAVLSALTVAVIPDAAVAQLPFAAVVGAWALFKAIALSDGDDVLVLSEDAVVDVGARRLTLLRWDDVTEVERIVQRRWAFLALRGPLEHSAVSGLRARLVVKIYRAMTLPLTEIDVDAEWLEDLVRRCVKDPQARREVARGAVLPH
jgi:hypothetical protein